ncbi:MAG: CbiX/SirB N-terminal domain-containing protein [Myxococcota bacterium]
MTQQALLLVDHGSRRAEANENLLHAAEAVRECAPDLPVFAAHMELAEPTIAEAFAECAAAGAEEVIVFPWFLARGRHVREDIPRLCAEAAEAHGLRNLVAEPFGVHRLLAELALERAGLR